MKKLIAILLTAALFASLFAGCKKTGFASSSKFESTARNYGLKVVNVKDSFYPGSTDITEALIATSDDGWQIEYYNYVSESAAAISFEDNSNSGKVSGGGTYAKTRSGNSAVFERSTADAYCIVVQAGTMLVYCEAPDEYGDTINSILVDMGVFS